jgi:preprotein translocase subunit SecB
MSDTQQPQRQVLGIIAQYTKDLSFENINSISKLQAISDDQPQIDVQIKVNVEKDDEQANVYNVSLITNIQANLNKPMFILDLDYSGEFEIDGFPDDLMDPILHIECPRLLFPFVRSIISSTVSEGGFPPLLLAPVNFADMYQQQLEAKDKTLQ